MRFPFFFQSSMSKSISSLPSLSFTCLVFVLRFRPLNNNYYDESLNLMRKWIFWICLMWPSFSEISLAILVGANNSIHSLSNFSLIYFYITYMSSKERKESFSFLIFSYSSLESFNRTKMGLTTIEGATSGIFLSIIILSGEFLTEINL